MLYQKKIQKTKSKKARSHIKNKTKWKDHPRSAVLFHFKGIYSSKYTTATPKLHLIYIYIRHIHPCKHKMVKLATLGGHDFLFSSLVFECCRLVYQESVLKHFKYVLLLVMFVQKISATSSSSNHVMLVEDSTKSDHRVYFTNLNKSLAKTNFLHSQPLFAPKENSTIYGRADLSQLFASSLDFFKGRPHANASSANQSQNATLPPHWNNPILGFLLVTITIVTIFGNSLVIFAVVRERHLKSATNYYIASLAVADLIVGVAVMPFNSVNKMTNDFWLFGDLWCDIWHSMDVFASTASINSLLFIALDRHSAISDPINYHTRWLSRYWVVFVALIWVCSAFISFPAIAYWRWITTEYVLNQCIFPDDIFYLIFSSLVSFYIPLTIMVVVYIRIYRAATNQMNAIKTGQKFNVKTGDGSPLTLRIHRGGYHKLDLADPANLKEKEANGGGAKASFKKGVSSYSMNTSKQKSLMVTSESDKLVPHTLDAGLG